MSTTEVRSRSPAALRRCVLLLSFLISGGLLLFPRTPLLLAIVVLCVAAPGFRLAIRRPLFPILVLLTAILLVTFFRPGPLHFDSVVVRFANFLAGAMLLQLYLDEDRGALARDLYALLKWFAVQAIATVVLAHSVGFLFVPITVLETTYQTLLLIFNYHVTLEDSGGLIRPDGFFYEPGVFQMYLNLYLYLALFTFRSRRQSLLAVLAVLTTQSTTGLIICILLLGGFLAGRLRHVRFSRRVMMSAAALVLAVPIGLIAYDNVVTKLTGELQGSSWAREYDLFTGLNVIAEYPLLGIGFDYEQYYAASSRLGYADTLLEERLTDDRGNTNGIVFLLYSLGIPLGLPFLYGMFRQRLFQHRLLVGLLLLLSLLGESIIFTPFILMIIFSGLIGRRHAARPTTPALAAAP